jgi:hypothetical protein
MASYMPTLGLRKLNTGGVVVGTDTFKIMLCTGTVPSANRDSANEYYGGSDFTEATGTNYTAGGNTLTLSESLYTTGGVHESAVANNQLSTSWSNVTLTNVTYAVLYDNTQSSKVAIAVYDFGGPQSVTANTFQINFTDTTPNYRVWYLAAA